MTPTGRATGRELFGDTVAQSWLPWDHGPFVRRFLARAKPDFGVLLETEIWPNLLAECHARGQLNGRCIPLIGCDAGTVEQVTKVHAQLSAEQLYGALREWLSNGVAREVTVKGAYYCVDSRIVTFLP